LTIHDVTGRQLVRFNLVMRYLQYGKARAPSIFKVLPSSTFTTDSYIIWPLHYLAQVLLFEKIVNVYCIV
jgi:hypothetical protein